MPSPYPSLRRSDVRCRILPSLQARRRSSEGCTEYFTISGMRPHRRRIRAELGGIWIPAPTYRGSATDVSPYLNGIRGFRSHALSTYVVEFRRLLEDRDVMSGMPNPDCSCESTKSCANYSNFEGRLFHVSGLLSMAQVRPLAVSSRFCVLEEVP